MTTLGYDSNGNLVHEIDPMGRSKIYQYDNLDQLVKRVLPDNIYEMSYDVRGNLVSTKNNETKVDFEYDLVKGKFTSTQTSRIKKVKPYYCFLSALGA